MRVTTNYMYNSYQRTLEDIQTKKAQEETRLVSNNDILSLSQDPNRLVTSKNLTNIIDRNSQFSNNIGTALSEIRVTYDNLDNISGNITKIRSLAFDATQTGNAGSMSSLSSYIKGILEDIVTVANSDFNGTYLFSGTKTSAQSLNKTDEANNDNPYEIITVEANEDNPSGLQVVFKGNNNDRIIDKDAYSQEIINTKQKDIFGENNEVFDAIISIYNLVHYNQDGSEREDTKILTNDEIAKVDEYQKTIEDFREKIDNANAKNGAKINRLEAIAEQITNENTNLKEYRSQVADTDVAKSTINLTKAEASLAYALQVGSKLNTYTLFSFLS